MQEILLANKGKFNFDHPDAFDNELMENCLAEILAGRSAKVLVVLYSMSNLASATLLLYVA